ncbi:NADPH:quinone oxidoreductase family protein [Ferrovibrio sp.]|uniref:NADPH:quinone oxidoreductase family protein n=1 Tax=Ferrovibrio sp. TaxID=1917215 RepID=UPI00345DDBE2|nr:NADPH:quinone oxidoreductase family protein [Ferrovibrio sp.]
MKAMVAKAWGGPDSLVLEDLALPALGERDVRIRVHAAGLNFPDTLIIAGKYQVKPAFPFAPGMECGGVVEAVGAKVRDFKPGDRVLATLVNGAFAQAVVTNAANVFKIPDSMSFEIAAGFPITYGTTIHALQDRGRLKPGEVLLVHGAAGGVGLNAVELGVAMGATVIGTVGSDDKAAIVKQYGAKHVINYSTESIKDRVKELTGGNGADVIYDPVGGDAFDQSLRCINWDGRLLVVGFASGRIPEAPANMALIKGCSIVGVFWGAFAAREPQKNRANFAALFSLFEQGKLKPHVSAMFPLAQVPQAMQALLSRKTTGKVVIQVA